MVIYIQYISVLSGALVSKVFSPKGKLLQSNPTKFCRFLTAILHRISNEIDEFTEFSVNSHLLKFFSLCNDLRNNLLSNHTDDT